MRWSKCQKLFWVTLFGSSSIIYYVMSVFRPAAVPIYPLPGTEHSTLCGSYHPTPQQHPSSSSLPTVYLVTPTYPRREQVAELTRLGQTLLLVPNIHWVVAEDSSYCSQMVSDLLTRFAIPYTHLVSPQPNMYRKAKLKYNPRGVSSRRAGLHWILKNAQDGVVYFGDDDNTYDIRLFKEIANTKVVSMFPVGFIGLQGVSSPIVKNGKVVGFSDDWFAQRKFPIDMAGFAVSVGFMKTRGKLNKPAEEAMPYKAGYEEDIFLQNLNITLDDIEPLAKNCEEVMVWHTKTVKEKKVNLKVENEEKTNLGRLLQFLSFSGMADESDVGSAMKTCYGGKACKTQNWKKKH